MREGGREGGRENIMLRWMKKGNDVLLLQGKQKPGDREGVRGRRGGVELTVRFCPLSGFIHIEVMGDPSLGPEAQSLS